MPAHYSSSAKNLRRFCAVSTLTTINRLIMSRPRKIVPISISFIVQSSLAPHHHLLQGYVLPFWLILFNPMTENGNANPWERRWSAKLKQPAKRGSSCQERQFPFLTSVTVSKVTTGRTQCQRILRPSCPRFRSSSIPFSLLSVYQVGVKGASKAV